MLLLLLAAWAAATHAFDCPSECTYCDKKDRQLTYFCPLADSEVQLTGQMFGDVTFMCQEMENDFKSNNFTCNDFPTINFGNSMSLPSLRMIDCSPAMLLCINKAMNTSSIANVTLINTSEPLKKEHVQGLGDIQILEILKGHADRTVPIEAINSLTILKEFRMEGKVSLNRTPLTLHSHQFTNSTPLLDLTLSWMGIREVPDDAFNGLSSLKSLEISGNNFSEVGVNSLRGLDSLETLTLVYNGITKMAAGSLNHAPLLKSIYLSLKPDQDPLELTPGLFHNLTRLQTIIIVGGGVHLKIYNNSFSKLPSLKHLILENCGINLSDQPITGCEFIQYLSLSRNEIEDIPLSFFKDMTSLQRLDLSGNRIKKLDSGVFHSLESLEYLNLNGNLLEVLPDFLFSGLNNLKYISIDYNHLTFISPVAFQGAINLETISLKSNKLTLKSNDNTLAIQEVKKNILFDEITTSDVDVRELSPFKSLERLKNLYLYDNNINTMFEDWKMTINLKELDLSHNNFTFLHGKDCQFMSGKITVDLQYNQITSVNVTRGISPSDYKSLFDYRSPTNLILLENNPLICDCGLYNLSLRLQGYKPEENLSIVLMEPKFELGNAKCASPPRLEGELFKNVSPYDLNCDLPPEKCVENCSVCEMRPGNTDLFYKCMSKPRFLPNPEEYGLKSISLKLDTPPIYISDLKLELLNLSNIGLKEINFEPSKSVESIDFSNNNLTKIPVEFLKSHTTLYLSNNPFKCLCSNSEEILLLKESIFVKDLELITCDTGDVVILKDVYSLCNTKRAAVIVAATFIATVIIMAILIAIIYRFSRTILVFLIEKRLFPSCFVDDPEDKNKEYDVFISYAHKDREYVLKLLPKLENDFGLKTCVHYRDWAIGDFIPDQINRSVEKSRRTLILLSDNYLDSDYANMEFRAAHNLALRDGKTRVILILLHDITKNEKISNELKLHIKMNTYLKWDDFRFSEKLQKALPLKNNKKFVISNVFSRREIS